MNTIRELKQQEKYKNMLKRKNKEKKIYKDKNASLQFEKQKLHIALLNREKEIERLNNQIKEYGDLDNHNKFLYEENKRLNNIINRTTKYVQSLSSKGRGCDIYEDIKQEILKELKGSDKE